MPDQQKNKQLEKKLIAQKKEMLDHLQMNAEAWLELHERQIEYEENATNESLATTYEGLDQRAIQELGRIEKALRKIQEQLYGICELCGRKISTRRLQAMPAAERCLSCASQSVPTFEDQKEEGEDAEELEISSSDGVVELAGYLPSEKKRSTLLQFLQDTLGIEDIDDQIIIDPFLWQNRERTPGIQDPDQTDYEIAAEGVATEITGATESLKSGLPMDPADELIPQK